MSDAFREEYGTPEARRERIRAFGEECLVSIPENRRQNGLTLEIGCGHGHWLTAYSESMPEETCIGIDLNTKRIEKARSKREKRGLPLLFFFKAEAMEFLEHLPETLRLRRTVLLFPDPWPKKRHHKRRLIRQPFLDLLASRSIPKAELCFRTDHEGYFDWTVKHINEIECWNIQSEVAWPFEHETFFQKILPEHQSFLAVRSD